MREKEIPLKERNSSTPLTWRELFKKLLFGFMLVLFIGWIFATLFSAVAIFAYMCGYIELWGISDRWAVPLQTALTLISALLIYKYTKTE